MNWPSIIRGVCEAYLSSERPKLISDIVQVQQLPFIWNLAISQKLDHIGNLIDTYEREDLVEFWYPKEYKKGHRRERLRKLEYDLVWEIIEIQVKLYIRPIFLYPIGPLTTQLAKERPLSSNDKTYSRESRSKALKRDIEISSNARRNGRHIWTWSGNCVVYLRVSRTILGHHREGVLITICLITSRLNTSGLNSALARMIATWLQIPPPLFIVVPKRKVE
jgi:hypothetical protein